MRWIRKLIFWSTSVQRAAASACWSATMRAVLCSAFTGPEDLRIGEIEEPKPASDEILIDVHAASVSFMDHLLVSGRYQMRPSTPFVPGTEAAGVVIAGGGKIQKIRAG